MFNMYIIIRTYGYVRRAEINKNKLFTFSGNFRISSAVYTIVAYNI